MIKTIVAVVAILAIAFCLQVFRGSGAPDEPLVGVATTDEVLSLIRQGKKVVFVDAREEEEWQEERIPGAINISLREVAALDRSTLGDPDLVVAYCLKDFRGFEVAKALKNAGVENASILAELGINGWKKEGLPTLVPGENTEPAALAALDACARDPAQCSGGM